MKYENKSITTIGEALINHEYIVYADSLNVMNGFKPFKIASRIKAGKYKTIWCKAVVLGTESYETAEEAYFTIKDWLRLANIKYEERSIKYDRCTGISI